MFEVKKCGKTNFGYWAYGTLKYKGFEVSDIFAVNQELEIGKSYAPNMITLKRDKKNNLRFKIVV